MIFSVCYVNMALLPCGVRSYGFILTNTSTTGDRIELWRVSPYLRVRGKPRSSSEITHLLTQV